MQDRRAFLYQAATLAGVGLTGAGAATFGQDPVEDKPSAKLPKLKKALKYSMIGIPGSPKEKLSAVSKLGFEGVEIDRPGNDDLSQLAAASKATGVVIHGVIDSVHWSKPLSSPKEEIRAAGLAALRSAIQDAGKIGADTVLLVPGVVNQEVNFDICWERSTEEVKKAIPDAEKAKVKIAIEVVWNNFITNPKQLCDYVDQFKSPWVGAYFDVSNMLKYGIPAAAWIRTLEARMLKLDFKGYSIPKANAAKDDWKGFDVKIGEGSEDWPAVLAACRDVGYKGWATAEVKGGDAKWLAEVSERMSKVLQLNDPE